MTDSLGFLDAVGGLPEQLADARRSARAAFDGAELPAAGEIDNVVVLGMGVPWQTDEASCLAGYDLSTYLPLPSFWAARVPNEVLSEKAYFRVLDEQLPMAQRLKHMNYRQFWLRDIDISNNDRRRLHRLRRLDQHLRRERCCLHRRYRRHLHRLQQRWHKRLHQCRHGRTRHRSPAAKRQSPHHGRLRHHWHGHAVLIHDWRC